MARPVKCAICGLQDQKENMVQETNKKYYHNENCHNEYISQVNLKKEENQKWSDLYEYIKELFDIMIVPPRNIKRLHELRNGFDFKEGKREQRYKQGVPYDLMMESFKLSEDKVKWFMKDVLRGGKDAEDINKCITMMLNGLNTAWQARIDKKTKEEKQIKELSQTTDRDMSIDTEVTYKKKKNNGDISNLL